MTLKEWISTTARQLQQQDIRGLRDSSYQLYAGAWRRAGRAYNYGTPIYEHDWDLLIVMDACRYDLLQDVVGEYDFLDQGRTNSVGSATEEWMLKNFNKEYLQEMRETVYVTGNPHSAEEGVNKFYHTEEVWSHSWDDDIGTTLADDVTEYAVTVGRQLEPQKCIVHYMQPHHPFVNNPELNEGIGFERESGNKHIWEKLRHGKVSHQDVWNGYRENLCYVLDNIRKLLNNFHAERVLITSDHGNAMGEFGIYGHPMYVPIPPLKRVPLCRTTAVDSGEMNPNIELSGQRVDRNVSQRLHDLGYS